MVYKYDFNFRYSFFRKKLAFKFDQNQMTSQNFLLPITG